MNKKIIAVVVAFVVVAGGSFYGGMTYQKSQAPARGQFGGQFARTGAGQGGRGANGGFAAGTILSKDESSLSIQLPNNAGSKIVLYTSSTPVMKSVSGAPSDLVVGERVTVAGTPNADGSITAQSIQLGTSTRQFGGGGGAPGQ